MKKARLGWLLAPLLALAPVAATGAEACVVETTLLGRTSRTCMLNVGMETARFHALCEEGKRSAEAAKATAVTFQVSYAPRCPPGWLGSCAVDPPAGKMVSHFYEQREMARAKAACLSGKVLPPGVWKDG